MRKITIDEKNKRRIQKYIKQEIEFSYGYEEDIVLLEQNSELTERLARKVFEKIMNDAQSKRTILELKEDDEFKEQIEKAFAEYDTIPKPEELEKYGFYDGSYSYMEIEDVYSNMQIAFQLVELSNKRYAYRDLRNIARTAINSIDGIDKYNIELQPEAHERLQKIREELRTLLSKGRTDIEGIQASLDLYNSYAMDIWNQYLTDVNDTKSDEYRWLVHNLTKGELKGDFRNKYMSTSILTNNVMGLYGSANYGLILRPKHIVSASYKDTYTLNDRENDEEAFNIRPPIMLPQEIEEICMQQTIEANGEILNYDQKAIYPEIVVDEYEMVGIYYISNGEHELTRNYDRAKRIAEERGLPLIERDISRYRMQHELEPMTESTKKGLCRDILQKCCVGDKELQGAYNTYYRSFVDTHFQEFYEQYMKLKEKGDYSKDDILKAFSEIARDDIYFKKISQNIEGMYLTDEQKKQPRPEQDNNSTSVEINEFGESIRHGNIETLKETTPIKKSKELEETKEERIRPMEESIGKEYENTEQKMQKVNNSTVNLWMNRFSSWYSAIDRVSQNVKAKFVKTKSDIVRAISDRLREKNNKKNVQMPKQSER